MGISKTALFTAEQKRVALLAKALSHPARVAILMHLAKRKQCICGDIVAEIPLAQSTISQHLKELKKAGIIHGEIEGTSTCYCINPTVWKEMKTMLTQFFNNLECC